MAGCSLKLSPNGGGSDIYSYEIKAVENGKTFIDLMVLLSIMQILVVLLVIQKLLIVQIQIKCL